MSSEDDKEKMYIGGPMGTERRATGTNLLSPKKRSWWGGTASRSPLTQDSTARAAKVSDKLW